VRDSDNRLMHAWQPTAALMPRNPGSRTVVALVVLVQLLSCEVASSTGLARFMDQERLDEESIGAGGSFATGSGKDTESTEDDDGYAKVALAALRAPMPEDPDEGPEAAQLRDRAFRTVVASRVRAARSQHKVMAEFMRSFSRNLKLSVLEDSRGDMPEDERLAAISALKQGKDFHLKNLPHHAIKRQQQKQHERRHQHNAMRMLNGAPARPQDPEKDEPEAVAQEPRVPEPSQALPAALFGNGVEMAEPPGGLAADAEEAPPAAMQALLGHRSRRTREAPEAEFEDAPPARMAEDADSRPAELGRHAHNGVVVEWFNGRPPREHRRPPPPLLFANSEDGSLDGDGRKPAVRGWSNEFSKDREKDKSAAQRGSCLGCAALLGFAHIALQVALLMDA